MAKLKLNRFTKDMEKILRRISVAYGGHDLPAMRPVKADDWNKGVCIMEAIAYVTNQEHTDHPVCVSPVLSDAAIRVNDSRGTNDDPKARRERNRLKALAPELIGTRPTREYTLKSGEVKVKPASPPGFRQLERRRFQAMVEEAKRRGVYNRQYGSSEGLHWIEWGTFEADFNPEGSRMDFEDAVAILRAGIRAVSRREVKALL